MLTLLMKKKCRHHMMSIPVNRLKASDCAMTEANELLKNMQFRDDSCSIQAYTKKRLSNSDLAAIINCTHLIIAPIIYALRVLKKPSQPPRLLSDYSLC